MTVHLLFFGLLKDLFKAGHERLDLPDASSVRDLLAVLKVRSAIEPAMWPSLAVAVNRSYASLDTVLRDGDEVALLPPVSGGTAEPRMRVEILDCELPTAEVLAQIRSGPDGAVCTFEGIVRNHTRDRQTLHLDYEAYRDMALTQMQVLAREALATYSIRDVAILHRLGRLNIGETSVLIVVASAHRGAAFDACRFLIDTLKKQVPIWKKETFVDGVIWADGEPFPTSIALHRD